jgi:hypothetical protein
VHGPGLPAAPPASPVTCPAGMCGGRHG